MDGKGREIAEKKRWDETGKRKLRLDIVEEE